MAMERRIDRLDHLAAHGVPALAVAEERAPGREEGEQPDHAASSNCPVALPPGSRIRATASARTTPKGERGRRARERRRRDRQGNSAVDGTQKSRGPNIWKTSGPNWLRVKIWSGRWFSGAPRVSATL